MVAKFLDHNDRQLKQRWQQRQRERPKGSRFIKPEQQLYTYHSFLHFSKLSLHDCDMKLPNFTRPLSGVREHNTRNFLFPLLNLDTVFSGITLERFANTWQIKWNWIRSMKFETVRIHFGLLSSRNFATMATWRNDFSSLLCHFIRSIYFLEILVFFLKHRKA